MRKRSNRRQILKAAGACGAALLCADGTLVSCPGGASAGNQPPAAPDHDLTVISGKPLERGREYGRRFRDSIRGFLEKEIYSAFTGRPSAREAMLKYAAGCGRAIARYSPPIHEEIGGISEGSGLAPEEVVLITLHEELYHRGVLPSVDHCTALAAGPPDTADGCTYVGQTWDWMVSVYGLSSMLLWKRPEGPDLLAYSYPGLWVGAGMNSAGIALCWTSGQGLDIPGPRVGIPSYVLLAQMLYQDSLKSAIEEARRATHAGWFTFILADGKGQLANVEGTPKALAVELRRGHMARSLYGTREFTGTADGEEVKFHPQCQRMWDLLEGGKGKLDQQTLRGFFGDHQSTICKHYSTLDAMLFNTTSRRAYVARGPGCSGRWREFSF